MNEYVQSVYGVFIFSKPMKEFMGSTNLFVFFNHYGAIKVPMNSYWLHMKVGTRARVLVVSIRFSQHWCSQQIVRRLQGKRNNFTLFSKWFDAKKLIKQTKKALRNFSSTLFWTLIFFSKFKNSCSKIFLHLFLIHVFSFTKISLQHRCWFLLKMWQCTKTD